MHFLMADVKSMGDLHKVFEFTFESLKFFARAWVLEFLLCKAPIEVRLIPFSLASKPAVHVLLFCDGGPGVVPEFVASVPASAKVGVGLDVG